MDRPPPVDRDQRVAFHQDPVQLGELSGPVTAPRPSLEEIAPQVEGAKLPRGAIGNDDGSLREARHTDDRGQFGWTGTMLAADLEKWSLGRGPSSGRTCRARIARDRRLGVSSGKHAELGGNQAGDVPGRHDAYPPAMPSGSFCCERTAQCFAPR